MAKYKFNRCTSVVIAGVLFEKKPDLILDSEKLPIKELEAACKAGYIELIEEEKQPVIISEFPEDMPGDVAIKEAGITTFEALLKVEDFTSIDGIGKKTAEKLTQWLIDNEKIKAPEAAPDVTPDVTPEATPEAALEVTPEAALEVTPEITPEVVSTEETESQE